MEFSIIPFVYMLDKKFFFVCEGGGQLYRNVTNLLSFKVLSNMPSLKMTVTTEVVDDEEQHVVTAGAIITVTILIKRNVFTYFYQLRNNRR